MPKLELTALCDDILPPPGSEGGEKISLIGLWDYLSAAAFPAHFRFAVFYRWRKVEGEQLQALPREAHVRLCGPVGAVGSSGGNPSRATIGLASTKEPVVFDPFGGVYRHRAYFEIYFPVPGKYQVEFYFDDVLAHVQTFEVVLRGH